MTDFSTLLYNSTSEIRLPFHIPAAWRKVPLSGGAFLYRPSRGDPHLFERLFLINWENNRDCHLTVPISLKTMEVQIKGDQWNMRFRTVQVYCHWGGFLRGLRISVVSTMLSYFENITPKCEQKNNNTCYAKFLVASHAGVLRSALRRRNTSSPKNTGLAGYGPCGPVRAFTSFLPCL